MTASVPRDECKSLAALWAPGLIVLATIAAFSNSFCGPFIFDDKGAIRENPTIRRLWPLSTPLCPPSGETVTGRPVLNLSFALNYAVSGVNVSSYHATNLAIHIAAALVLFGLLRRTLLLPAMRDDLRRAATPVALSVAVVWAVHPLHTESVTYVVQRAESLAAIFYLLVLYGLVRGAMAKKPSRWYGLSALTCLLGMATKETMVSAPLIALLYDRIVLAGSFRDALRRRGGLYVALGSSWLLLAWLIGSSGGRGASAGFGHGISSFAYLGTQFGAIFHYLRLAVWPSPLVFDYGVDLARNARQIVPFAIMVGLLGLATIIALWRWPKLGFLGVAFFGLLAPSSSVVPVVTQTMAEHRMYLALIAVIVAFVIGVYVGLETAVRRQWLSRRQAAVLGGACALVVAGLLGTVTFQRNRDYAAPLTIWSDTAVKAPSNARAHYNLANALVAARRTEDAMAAYRRALGLKPDYAEAHVNLGAVLAAHSRLPEAATQFEQALAVTPDDAEVHDNLGLALAMLGRYDESISHLRKAIELQPDYVKPMNELASVLAACPDAAIRNPQEAITLACRAERLTGGTQVDVLDTLAAAYAAAGQYSEALRTARTALQLAIHDGNRAVANDLRHRIELYQSTMTNIGGHDASAD